MTHLSKRPLDTAMQKRMYDIFTNVLADTTSSDDVAALLFDFLTPAESVMLPKRIGIAYLLIKQYDQRAIAQYLNVSFTTITKVSTALKKGGKGYRTMLERIQKKEGFNTMLETMETGILAFLSKGTHKSSLKDTTTHTPQTYEREDAERTPDILPKL